MLCRRCPPQPSFLGMWGMLEGPHHPRYKHTSSLMSKHAKDLQRLQACIPQVCARMSRQVCGHASKQSCNKASQPTHPARPCLSAATAGLRIPCRVQWRAVQGFQWVPCCKALETDIPTHPAAPVHSGRQLLLLLLAGSGQHFASAHAQIHKLKLRDIACALCIPPHNISYGDVVVAHALFLEVAVSVRSEAAHA